MIAISQDFFIINKCTIGDAALCARLITHLLLNCTVTGACWNLALVYRHNEWLAIDGCSYTWR